MRTIQVYDPPLCCSTGVCGTTIDPALLRFAVLLKELIQKGAKVERYNLSQQPMAFVQNAVVKALLDKEGVQVLPLTLLDGAVHLKGRYITATELDAFRETVMGNNAPTGS